VGSYLNIGIIETASNKVNMDKHPHVAVVGATGSVGQEVLQLLEERSFPMASLRCLASSRSSGVRLQFRGEQIPVTPLDEKALAGCDLAFFASGSEIAKTYAPQAAKNGTLVIDKSCAFRMDPSVPLVIPEINPHALKDHKNIISSPNCTAAIMLMVLAPLHKKFGVRRVIASTYQAMSGAGAQAVQELLDESRAYLDRESYQRSVFPFPVAFNVFPHNSTLGENGYVEEEMRVVEESHKILEDTSVRISATCVRVPTLRAHAESLNIEFTRPISVEDAYATLACLPGLSLLESRENNRFPMPTDASGCNDVLYGRIRKDLSHACGLEMWVVGDQLRKGAALNAIQIAEVLR
jgi:aspartate-semialdehyde dehydrogenase